MGLSTGARERDRRLASSEAPRGGLRLTVVRVPSVDRVAKEAARHTGADRTRVRRGPPSTKARRRAS
jgi:hypothetical protein